MSTINETVQQTLRQHGWDGYQQYAGPVVAALENREREIVSQLLTFADSRDMDPDDVQSVLSEAGLTMPEPEPEPDVPEEDSASSDGQPEWVTAIMARLDTLERVARSRGLL